MFQSEEEKETLHLDSRSFLQKGKKGQWNKDRIDLVITYIIMQVMARFPNEEII